MRLFAPAAAFALAASSVAAAQCPGSGFPILLTGMHSPYLAGQPDGTTIKQDTAPAQSPFHVPVTLQAGDRLQFFNVSGDVNNVPGGGGPGPDGGALTTATKDLGISGFTMPINSMLGVFMGDDVNMGLTPPALDFSTPASVDFDTLLPRLHQVFFIGDGLRIDGSTRQDFVVPDGATRLFLGSADAFGWNNNGGTFTLEIDFAPSFSACPDMVSLTTGGTQDWFLDAGEDFALLPYLVLGSTTGTTPGFPVGIFTLPLNVDSYTFLTLNSPNTPPFTGSFGLLDNLGEAQGKIDVPTGLSPALAGLVLHHAYVVIELLPTLLHAPFISDAKPLMLVP